MQVNINNTNQNDNVTMQKQLQPQLQQKNLKYKKKEIKIYAIYSSCLISRTIILPITAINQNIKQTLEKNISHNFEGKCIVEGFVRPNSSKIISYSNGVIKKGIYISYDVVFTCDICFPVEGTIISCIAKNITKAGITGQSSDETPSPIIVHIARDHSYNNSYFSSIQEGDKINVRVIGQRYELNDKFISVIGEVIRPRPEDV